MKHALVIASLAVAIMGSAATAEEKRAVVVPAKWRPLKRTPTSQHATITALVPLDEIFILRGRALAATAEEGGVRMETTPGSGQRVLVKLGDVIDVGWTEGEQRIDLKLQMPRTADGTWALHSAQALEFKVAGETIALIDANCDGILNEPGVDAYFHGGGSLVIPFSETTVIGSQHVHFSPVSPGAKEVELLLLESYGNPVQKHFLGKFNRFRAEHGLDPVRLVESLSKDVDAYMKYVRANGGEQIKTLDPESREYSEEAVRGALRTTFCGLSFEHHLSLLFTTYFARTGLSFPGLNQIGVSLTDGVFTGSDTWGNNEPERSWFTAWKQWILMPGDGSTSYPTTFGRYSATKDPVPDAGGRGASLTVLFPLRSTKVTNFEGRLFELTSKREISVPVLQAVPDGDWWMHGIIAEKSLKNRTRYRAEYQWIRNGIEERASAVFTTE